MKKFTLDKVLKAYHKCIYKEDFKWDFPKEYTAAFRMGILKDLTSKLLPTPSKTRIWFEDTLTIEAKKYDCIKDFQTYSSGAYDAARDRGLLEKITSHYSKYGSPERPYKHQKYTIPFLLEYAKQFETIKELNGANESIYSTITKLKIAGDAFAHMRPLGNLKFRCIYGIFFPNKEVYFGLTDDFQERKWSHARKSSNKNIKNLGGLSKGKMIQITDYMPETEAQILEGFKEIEFEKLGWKILNIAKTGGLGGHTLKWPKEKILEVASKCKDFQEFKTNHLGALGAMYDLRIQDEVHAIWGGIKPRKSKWDDFNNCKIEASKYGSRHEFDRGCHRAADSSRKNKWMDIFFKEKRKNK